MRVIECDLAIIGAGIAGMAASLFAMKRGINVAQCGNTGSLAYTTGYLDLIQDKDAQPWQAITKLRDSEPQHPYAAISDAQIKDALEEFSLSLSDIGVEYTTTTKDNFVMLTPAGTVKQSYAIPSTMLSGAEAMAAKKPCLFVDIKRLRGYSAPQIVANIKSQWPNTRTASIEFPGALPGEIYPEVMARSLEVEATVDLFAQEIKKHLGDAQCVALPAILGIHNPQEVHRQLSEKLGLPVFEIPTMPPAVPGIRLREIFEQALPQKGLHLIPQQKVEKIDFADDHVTLHVSDAYGPIAIKAKAALLASGRFLSGGLNAEIAGVVEPLVGLPVHQPQSRNMWYEEEYLTEKGHEIHTSGIEIDPQQRPLGASGTAHHPRLFAAGSILAHQDWIRTRSGAGIAIATAYQAIDSIKNFLDK